MHKNKILSAFMAAGLVVSGSAYGDSLTIYGKMHFSWDYVDTDDPSGDSSDDATGVARQARIGFKGIEDLGNGLKALWQVETQVLTDDVTDTGGDLDLRNTFVGLNGAWGTVLLGMHDSPYKMTTSGKVDLFVDRIADYNNIFGAPGFAGVRPAIPFDGRQRQVVLYITPTFNGAKAMVSRESVKVDEDPAGTISGDDDSLEWSLAGMYENGPLYLALAYEYHSGNSGVTGISSPIGRGATATDAVDAWKVAGTYTFGNSRVGAIYEDIDHDASGSALSRAAWLLNFSHKIKNNTLKLQYINAEDGDSATDTGADNWSLGVDHNFSKRTLVYAVYTDLNNDSGANYGLRNYAAGEYHATPVTVGGTDPSAFSVGIEHKF